MRYLLGFILTAVIALASCSRSARLRQALSDAEKIAFTHPDSTLAIIAGIDPSDIKEDSLRALYHIIKASAHKANESSMVSDSLVGFSFEYYKNRDFWRFLQSGDMLALHRFWAGDGTGCLMLLDSLIALPGVPEEQMIQLLQSRIGVGGIEFDNKRNITYIKRLQELDKDSANQIDYSYQLCENYQFAGHSDSALVIIDRLIDYAHANGLDEDRFKYTYEKVGILEELGRYAESNMLADYLLENAPGSSATQYLRFWKSLNYFNMGDFDIATRELSLADSYMADRDDPEKDYYESFANPLREFLAYRHKGNIKVIQLATINNSRRDLFNRLESTRWETEQNALKQENKALILKTQNERKTAILVIIVLTAAIIGLVAAWNMQKRKRRAIEAEERAEALQKMVDELNQPSIPLAGQESLRRAMLQQLGIIKMVAETPTEQNREMLRRVSSINGETDGALVNWQNVYEIIDTLYSGFHASLQKKYGDVLSEKEMQIIVLMIARFSTKEISVITMQTTATIYVRKSSIRKKIGAPEKEDIVAFLRQ
ncbi:MAG: hypothetical protein K2M12_09020 [Muribaculaceae bacterium]|nr:hypothetical protein [Muribaculaceae bacterium]